MIVVDTHAVIWLTQEPKLLSPVAGAVLIEARARGELAVSDFSLREIAHLVQRKRANVSSSLDVYLNFVASLFVVLPLNARIAERSVRFGPGYPNDPVDQVVGATAIVHGARLVTADQKIRSSGEVICVW